MINENNKYIYYTITNKIKYGLLNNQWRNI